jgi:hypothetical protein
MTDLNPTTRVFPRTLGQAFKDDPENIQWFFPPPKHRWGMLEAFMVYVGLVLWICLIYYFVRN